jgi:glutamate racemase
MTAAATALSQLSDQYQTLSVRDVGPKVKAAVKHLSKAEVMMIARQYPVVALSRKDAIEGIIGAIEWRVLMYQRTKRI